MKTAVDSNVIANTVANVLGEIGDAAAPAVPVAPEPWVMNPENVSIEMSLDQLGAAARNAFGRGAEWAWALGRALTLAEIKFGTDTKSFKAWKDKWLDSDLKPRTVQRYTKLGLLDFDQIRGKSINDVYAKLWPSHAAKKAGKKTAKKPNKVKRTTAAEAVTYLLGEISKNSAVLLDTQRQGLETLYQELGAILNRK